ncbi:nickel insertion protein [Bacillus sp. CECT 9360]|uniref:nickel insertion protein n=1 Tax=Bacillus sp. CECT 9360 TaxID=2845821 RepID=UPI001E45BB87|nr:nickel insertion protein [Bacillus sp. CECT 9360]CAH0343847.1 Pyridinium-3,5-bisthiocarboxylic acid mononucleotide nickel insertion protein [Bacillus sp. CECT 9360]
MQHQFEHTDHEMIKIEVNLDDIPGEWLGHVMDLLFDAGANDVFYVPIYMKKNRPGTMLQVLCSESRSESIMNIIFQETTTLGVRYYPLSVKRLGRQFKEIQTPWGAVSVKEGLLNNKVVQQSPEYSQCKEIADKYGVPLQKVYQAVWTHLNG